MAPKAPKAVPFPGFTALNDQIFIRDGEELAEGATRPTDHPRVVIIYGWGDAVPKHVAKYTDGYRTLYPHARQVVILSPIAKAMTESLQTRADGMKLVVDATYPPESIGAPDQHAVLVHAMSNTGGINYASTLKNYQQRHNRPMPHRLAVCDSTPGTPYMTWETLKRWSNAAAMAVAPYVPLPYVVTQTFVGFILALNRGYQLAIGWEPAPVFSCNAINDESFVPKTLRRLYFYGRDDVIIHPEEIEENIAAAEKKGFVHDAILFEGSGHCGHMRMFPERYWGAVQESWKATA